MMPTAYVARMRFWMTVQAIALLVVLAMVGVLAWYSLQTHNSLCALKSDLQTRADATRQILAKHSEDVIHVYGLSIPRDQLMNNLANQDRTLKALDSLNCTEVS